MSLKAKVNPTQPKLLTPNPLILNQPHELNWEQTNNDVTCTPSLTSHSSLGGLPQSLSLSINFFGFSEASISYSLSCANWTATPNPSMEPSPDLVQYIKLKNQLPSTVQSWSNPKKESNYSHGISYNYLLPLRHVAPLYSMGLTGNDPLTPLTPVSQRWAPVFVFLFFYYLL